MWCLIHSTAPSLCLGIIYCVYSLLNQTRPCAVVQDFSIGLTQTPEPEHCRAGAAGRSGTQRPLHPGPGLGMAKPGLLGRRPGLGFPFRAELRDFFVFSAR